MKEPYSKENNSRIFHKLSNEEREVNRAYKALEDSDVSLPKRLSARSAAQLAEQSCEEMIQNLKINVAERGERSIL